MKRIWTIAAALVLTCTLCAVTCRAQDAAGPDKEEVVVTKYAQGSGVWHGYRLSCPAYEAVLSCNPDFGFYALEVKMEGEKLTHCRGSDMALGITDHEAKKAIFRSFEFHKDKTEFTLSQKPGKIEWMLSPAAAKTRAADYAGSLAYAPGKMTLTHNWTLHEDIKGTTLVANLNLGIPLLTGCSFEAVLADGTKVTGEIPDELPAAHTRYTPDALGKAIASILFDTRKGPVKMSFVPDQHTDKSKQTFPILQTTLHVYEDKTRPPFRRYEFYVAVPEGKKDVPRSYSIVYEFPE